MACSSCGCNPCNCSNAANCPQCECSDPGSLAAGRHAYVLDYALCPKRLSTPEQNSILVGQRTGSGQLQVFWTNTPCVTPTALTVQDGVGFAGLLASMGDAGCWRSLTPDANATGWLRAFNGEFILAELPTSNIPDPLQVEDLTVTDDATIKDLTIATGGSFCFPSVAEGTITTPIGLNASGCMVKQTSGSGSNPLGISIAEFYENPTETSTATPNTTVSNGQSAQIGNEIYDPDNIAQVNSTTSVKVLSAGRYSVRWFGLFAEGVSSRLVNLDLFVNGSRVAFGTGSGRIANSAVANRSASVSGEYVQALAANDILTLVVSSDGSGDNNLQKAKLVLTRWGAA